MVKVKIDFDKTINDWLYQWSQVIRDIDSIFPLPTARNLILHVYSKLHYYSMTRYSKLNKSKPSKSMELINLLRQVILSDNYESVLLQKNCNLRLLKNMFSNSSKQYDISKFLRRLDPIRKKIISGQFYSWIISDIKDRLTTDKMFTDEEWYEISVLLIQELSLSRDKKEIGDLLYKSLNRTVATVLCEKYLQKKTVNRKTVKALAKCIANSLPFFSFHPFVSNNRIEEWFDNKKVEKIRWLSAIDEFCFASREKMSSVNSCSSENPPYSWGKWYPANQLAREILFLEILSNVEPLICFPPFVQLKKAVFELLVRINNNSDLHIPNREFENNFPYKFSRIVANHIVKFYFSRDSKKLNGEIKRIIWDNLRDYVRQNRSRINKSYPKFDDLIVEFLSSQKASWKTHEITRRIYHEVMNSARALFEKNTSFDFHLKMARKMWDDLIDQMTKWMIKYASEHKDVKDYIKWKAFSTKELQEIVGLIGKEMHPSHARWIVCFKLKKLQCKDRIWKLGNVTYYDPFAYHLVLEGWFNPLKVDEKDPYGFALTTVEARTSWEAMHYAKRLIRQNVELLLASHSLHEFIIPMIDIPTHYVAYKEKNILEARGSWQRGPEAVSEHADVTKHKLVERADELNKLTTFLPPYRGNVLAEKLGKLIHWYQNGRMQQTFVDQFLYYWIALEQVEKDWRKIAAIAETWHGTETAWLLENEIRDVYNFIQKNPSVSKKMEKENEFVDWKKTKILVKNSFLKYLSKICDDQKTRESIQQILTHLSNPPSRKKIAIFVQWKQKNVYFTMSLLFAKRNEIVHTAFIESADMVYYTETLKSYVEKFLTKIHNSLVDNPRINSIEQIINNYNEPFLKWEPGRQNMVIL